MDPMVPLLRNLPAALLDAAADLALVLLGLVLVDLLAHGLHVVVADLVRVGLLHAFGLLEPVAPGGVLGPDLAAVAVLLPVLLADLLLLVVAFLHVLGVIVALLPEKYKI